MNSPESHLLIILTAPSGAGKTTIARALLQRMPQLGVTISATTRHPRPHEVNGEDYYFLTESAFEKKISDQSFIEYEMVYPGKYYGTLYSELERIWQQKKYPVRVVDVLGAVQLKKKFSEQALSIFIKPPSIQALYERLESRNTDSEQAIKERIKRASMEMEFESHFDRVVVNDDLSSAVQKSVTMINAFINSSPEGKKDHGN